MKVFLSWSGGQSHKVALIFRDWLPSVIQEIEPYVSSEDIDKGARWSTDIAKELENSTFGILCVTRENINAPWLMFEAGALSKTMDKSLVSPFLFNIKRSEVGGPILQFQSTIFDKADLQKLVNTLNKACDKDCLAPDRLNKAFEVWYPTLEKELNALLDVPSTEDEKPEEALKDAHTQEILEEILELSRSNQKLIRNPDGLATNHIEETRQMVRELLDLSSRRREGLAYSKSMKRLHPMIFNDFFHLALSEIDNGAISIQMALAMVRDEFPWIYESGMETLRILKSSTATKQKEDAIKTFSRIVEFSFEHPIMRERIEHHKEWHIMMHEFPRMLEHGMYKMLSH